MPSRILVAVLLTAFPWTAVAPAAADPLDDLVGAVAKFRGVGAAGVNSYVVPLSILDDEEAAAPLLEAWSAPSDLYLTGESPATPTAIVRSWALFLEPMFVARTSLLGMDLAAGAGRIREVGAVRHTALSANRSRVEVDLPAELDTALPVMLQDIVRLESELDHAGRLRELSVDLRGEGGRVPERIRLTCTYQTEEGSLPELAEWTLPGGDLVRVRTTFRRQGTTRVPAERHITFPSRWDPGETEEIHVGYGAYDFAGGDNSDRFADRHVFRFDANGIVSDEDAQAAATTPRAAGSDD
ncbi:MAG: hypothetical protein DHS20C21_16460 [Gemmatimonadota bacterium]|nr:MAG: hypothetical protein DHS20C21_16460 [Gemmatimonadota bacterium]